MNGLSRLTCFVLLMVVASTSCSRDDELSSAAIPHPDDTFPEHQFSLEFTPLENSDVLDPFADQITINAEQFLDTLEQNVFQQYSMGYAIALIQDSEVLGMRRGGFAKAPQDGSRAWTNHTKLHVASTTKALTSLAILDALRNKGLKLDEKLAPYLPAYWEKGPTVNDITFFQLLTHRTGLAVQEGNGPAGFSVAKRLIEQGNPGVPLGNCEEVPAPFDSLPMENATAIERLVCPGMPVYQNPMFVVARVAATILDDRVSIDECEGEADLDDCWDDVTTGRFVEMLRERVFDPAGLTNTDVGRTRDFALAYSSIDDNDPGDGNGEILDGVGAVGIYLDIGELTELVSSFVSSEGIVSTADRIDMLRFGLGYTRNYLDPSDDRKIEVGGQEYVIASWGGIWGDPPQREKNNIYFLPGNIQYIAIYNSTLAGPLFNLSGTRGRSSHYKWVRCAYRNAITPDDDPIPDCP